MDYSELTKQGYINLIADTCESLNTYELDQLLLTAQAMLMENEKKETPTETEGHAVDKETVDKIKQQEGFVERTYYDLVSHKKTGDEGVLYCLGNGKYRFNGNVYSSKNLFDFSRSTPTIGSGTTKPVYDKFARENGMPEMDDGTFVNKEVAVKLIRFYTRDIASELATVPNKTIFDTLICFFYNTGKGALNKSSGEKYIYLMNKPSDTSLIDTKDIEGKEVKEPKSFKQLIDTNNWRAVCNRMTWWRRVGGKLYTPLIKKRDDQIYDIKESLKE